VAPQVGGPRGLEHGDARLGDDERRQLADHAAAGRAAAGVHDAALGVAALEAERERPVAVGVEAHAERLEVADGLRACSTRTSAGRPPREARGRRPRCRAGAPRGVVDGQRGGDPALRPVARGLRQRGPRDEGDTGALAGGGERGEEAGAAGAHHGDVGVEARHGAVP
jgi:hypothetical protein